jgi:hypothetical protein
MVASQQGRKHENRRTSIVGNHNQVAISDDMEEFMCAAVQ